MSTAIGVALLVSNAILVLALWGERRSTRALLERVADREPSPIAGWTAQGEPVYRVGPPRRARAGHRSAAPQEGDLVIDGWTPGPEPMRPRPQAGRPTRPPVKPSDMHRPPPPSPGAGRIGKPS